MNKREGRGEGGANRRRVHFPVRKSFCPRCCLLLFVTTKIRGVVLYDR